MAREKRQPVIDNFAWGCEWVISAVSLRLKLHLSKGIGSILYLMCQIINSNLLHKRKKTRYFVLPSDSCWNSHPRHDYWWRAPAFVCFETCSLWLLSKFQIYKAQFFKDCIPWDEDNKGKNDLVMKSLTFSKITRKIFRVFPHHTKIPKWGKMSSGDTYFERFCLCTWKKQKQKTCF